MNQFMHTMSATGSVEDVIGTFYHCLHQIFSHWKPQRLVDYPITLSWLLCDIILPPTLLLHDRTLWVSMELSVTQFGLCHMTRDLHTGHMGSWAPVSQPSSRILYSPFLPIVGGSLSLTISGKGRNHPCSLSDGFFPHNHNQGVHTPLLMGANTESGS